MMAALYNLADIPLVESTPPSTVLSAETTPYKVYRLPDNSPELIARGIVILTPGAEIKVLVVE